MIEPVMMIGTIIMILLMGTVALLALILAARKPTSLNRGLRTMSILMLCCILAAFMKYYLQISESGAGWIMLDGCISDVLYFVFIVSWIYVIGEFTGQLRVFSVRSAAAITAVYGICAEAIVLFASSYDYELDLFIVESGL